MLRTLIALTIATGCATTGPRPEAVLDDFHAAASDADEARYFGHMTPEGIFVGTDATERWDVEAFRGYAHPHFAKGKGWTYRPLERHVTLSPGGDVAWFDERLHNEKYGETRGSGVLVRSGERWRIAHYVLSFPVPNDVARDVVSLIRRGPAPEVPPDPALGDLQWLAGTWADQSEDGRRVEERWSDPEAGAMFGLNRTVAEGRVAFFEYLRIEARDGAVVYVASPRGQGATEFTLLERGEQSAVFANDAHDHPKRIHYRRDGDLLHVRIEGDEGASEWRWKRAD